mmetsp:Transcript_48101/g.112442  ORF Transcript_48101/g.112442 Transcript_48101/m.112442 type:complete len:130 (-) Transcript_48101:87-476(-)
MISDLVDTLRLIDPKIVCRIETGQVEDEDLMEELLRVHSNVQSVLELFDEKLAKVLAAAMPVDLLNFSLHLSDEPPARGAAVGPFGAGSLGSWEHAFAVGSADMAARRRDRSDAARRAASAEVFDMNAP